MRNVRNVRKAQLTLFRAALLEAFDTSIDGFYEKYDRYTQGHGRWIRVNGFGGILLRARRSRGWRVQVHLNTTVEFCTFDGFPLRLNAFGSSIEGGKSSLSSCATEIFDLLFPLRGEEAYQEWLESHEPLSDKEGPPSRVITWL